MQSYGLGSQIGVLLPYSQPIARKRGRPYGPDIYGDGGL